MTRITATTLTATTWVAGKTVAGRPATAAGGLVHNHPDGHKKKRKGRYLFHPTSASKSRAPTLLSSLSPAVHAPPQPPTSAARPFLQSSLLWSSFITFPFTPIGDNPTGGCDLVHGGRSIALGFLVLFLFHV